MCWRIGNDGDWLLNAGGVAAIMSTGKRQASTRRAFRAMASDQTVTGALSGRFITSKRVMTSTTMESKSSKLLGVHSAQQVLEAEAA